MSELWDALGTVVDPELDQPITELGFVHEAVIAEDHAHVRLRLPTYFCAPNFAYLMVADAYEAVRGLAASVDVRLEDHFAAEEINAGVAASAGFAGSFPGEAVGELGLDCSPESPLLLDDTGAEITAAEAPLRLRYARSVRVSIEGNAGFCRGLLHTRYPEAVGNQIVLHNS